MFAADELVIPSGSAAFPRLTGAAGGDLAQLPAGVQIPNASVALLHFFVVGESSAPTSRCCTHLPRQCAFQRAAEKDARIGWTALVVVGVW